MLGLRVKKANLGRKGCTYINSAARAEILEIFNPSNFVLVRDLKSKKMDSIEQIINGLVFKYSINSGKRSDVIYYNHTMRTEMLELAKKLLVTKTN